MFTLWIKTFFPQETQLKFMFIRVMSVIFPMQVAQLLGQILPESQDTVSNPTEV